MSSQTLLLLEISERSFLYMTFTMKDQIQSICATEIFIGLVFRCNDIGLACNAIATSSTPALLQLVAPQGNQRFLHPSKK